MTIADSRVVEEACRECGMPCTPTEYHPYAACLMFRGCHNSKVVRENLRPLSLLAEAESRISALEQEAVAETEIWARKCDALQSRLDAVSALADRWEKLAETHGIHAFTGNDHRLFANELRAALGGESPGNEEELK